MKTQLFAAMIGALPMLAYAQPATQAPIILRDSKGIIQAIEFSEKDASLSDQAFMKQYLQVTSDDAFVKANDKQRRPGYINDHFNQFYKGVKVDGGGYNFHYKAGKMYYAHGHYVKLTNLDVTPSITAQTARDVFAAYKKIPLATITDYTAVLLIKEIAPLDSTANLVYKIYLRSSHPANDEIGYIQAKTGQVILTEPILTHAAPITKTGTPTPSSRSTNITTSPAGLLTPATGTFATRYSGSRTGSTDDTGIGAQPFRLLDQTRGAIIHTRNLQGSTNLTTTVELTDNDNNWTTGEHSGTENDMALDVHWALQQIYDRLNNAHGINSFDDPASGAGFPINAHIRYGNTTIIRDNAFWLGGDSVLVFGDGAVTFRPVASVDVVAHEYGHGITHFQIGWVATGIQGSFNEGMSDIWGAIMQHRITGGNIWQIGEQLTLNNPCLRDLQNTNSFNVLQPIADTFGSTQYNASTDEYVRSGVLSHWAYLLANGGSGTNGVSNSYNVYGVGIDQLENLIVHAVFNNFLDNTTTYDEVRLGMINAARALCGNQNGVLVQQVENAWQAVNVGSASQSSISGADLLCTNYTYSITNLPEGSNVVAWSSSNTGNVTINSSGVATRVGSYSGYITLTATISDDCGSIQVPRTVYVGAPSYSMSIDGINTNSAYVAAGSNHSLNAATLSPGSASYNYTDYSGSGDMSISLSPSGSYAYVYVNGSSTNGHREVMVEGTNTCGTINQMVYLYLSGMFRMYPNPAKDELTLEFSNTQVKETLPTEITLLAEQSTTSVLSVSVWEYYDKKMFKDGNKIVLDVRQLPRGTYYLHVKYSESQAKPTERIRVILE